jgi:hypothetical protein
MGFLDSLFGRRADSPDVNPVRETLFGDIPLDKWPSDGAVSETFPWSGFVASRTHLAAGRKGDALEAWRRIVRHPGLESRHYLQAWHFLRSEGQEPPPEEAKDIMGVVVEVSLREGLDLLAAYADRSARYYNFSGAGVVWEHPDGSLDTIIDELLVTANTVVKQIGPWLQPRPSVPTRGNTRLSFLTPSGLHFGEGPMDVLSRDPMAGTILSLATDLMKALISKSAA